MPHLLDIFSYSFASSGCLFGPVFEYRDYIDFINKEKKYKLIPNPFVPLLKMIALSMVFMVLYLILIKKYPFSYYDTIDFK